MHMAKLSRRATRMLVGYMALSAAVACNDSTAPDEHDHADEIAAIRITAAGVSYLLDDNGQLTPSPLVLPANTPSDVSVAFLDDAGTDITDEIHDDEFEIRFTNLPAGVAFTRTGAFSGTFTTGAAADASAPMTVSLWHLEENHEDLGPFTIPVLVGIP